MAHRKLPISEIPQKYKFIYMAISQIFYKHLSVGRMELLPALFGRRG